jgi:hypothetical protein
VYTRRTQDDGNDTFKSPLDNQRTEDATGDDTNPTKYRNVASVIQKGPRDVKDKKRKAADQRVYVA